MALTIRRPAPDRVEIRALSLFPFVFFGITVVLAALCAVAIRMEGWGWAAFLPFVLPLVVVVLLLQTKRHVFVVDRTEGTITHGRSPWWDRNRFAEMSTYGEAAGILYEERQVHTGRSTFKAKNIGVLLPDESAVSFTGRDLAAVSGALEIAATLAEVLGVPLIVDRPGRRERIEGDVRKAVRSLR